MGGMNGDSSWFIVDLGKDLVVRQVSLKNSRNGRDSDSGTKEFELAVSSNGLEWSTVAKDELADPRKVAYGSPVPAQTFDVEGVGGSRFVRFLASSWFGDRAALNHIQ